MGYHETHCIRCNAEFAGGPGYCSTKCMEEQRAIDAEYARRCPCYCGLRPDGGKDYTCSHCP